MARTTLNIDDSVLKQVKRRSRKQGKSLGVLVSELLSEALSHDTAEPEPFEWYAQDLRPLVDIEDKEALYAALDGR